MNFVHENSFVNLSEIYLRYGKPAIYEDEKSKSGISRGVKGGNGARDRECSSALISSLELTETA